jgi:hypothetical protein
VGERVRGERVRGERVRGERVRERGRAVPQLTSWNNPRESTIR